MSEADRNAYVASGKALSYLNKMESDGTCGLEKGSVYGAAVAIPQIARSSGWSEKMTALAVRSYVFLILNIGVQVFLLQMIAEEEYIMNLFAGKMHLCDFGAQIQNCPDGPNCRGPLGTTYSPPRLYDFDVWSVRVFVRDSLLAIFPDRQEEIYSNVDPGEYGMEDYYCRLTCCFVFLMSMMDDLYKTLNLVTLLWHVPSDDSVWLKFDVPEWTDKEHAKKIHGWNELDLVKFGVAGMPLHWKFSTALFITIPKVLIWWCTTSLGMFFLLETAGIVDAIMNSMALTFIINMDELIFETLTSLPVKHMMEKLEEYKLFEFTEELDADDDILLKYLRSECGHKRWGRCFDHLLPRRLITVPILMCVFMWNYYTSNCQMLADGSWVSKPMTLPLQLRFNVLDLVTQSVEKGQETFWTMPPPD